MIALIVLIAAWIALSLWVYNPLSGVEGSVKVGTTAYAFTKWTASMKTVFVKSNNFTMGGYQTGVAGITSATITLESQTYDEGNMAFTSGNSYDFVLGYTSGVSLTITVMIESIDVTVDYEGGQPVKITGQSNGSFTAAIT
jgi:hypothetical protein